jgi:Na+-driven multidrug efflux pump
MEPLPPLAVPPPPLPPPVASTPRSSRRRLWKELRETSRLAAPIAASELASDGLHVIAGMYAGHLGPAQLGAAALATLFSNATGNALLAGVANSLDTLASQAVGARSWGLLGLHVHRGLALALAACVPISATWVLGGRVLAAAGGSLDPAVAALAGEYLQCLLLGLPAHAVWKVLKKELSALGHLGPALVGNALGLAVVAGLAPTLMWGTRLGFLGAPLATSAAQMVMAAWLSAYCLRWHASMAAVGSRLLWLLRVPAGRAAITVTEAAATGAPSPWMTPATVAAAGAAAALTTTSRSARRSGGGRVRLRTDSWPAAAAASPDRGDAVGVGIQLLPAAPPPAGAVAPSVLPPESQFHDYEEEDGSGDDDASEVLADAVAAGTPHSTRSAPPELDVGAAAAIGGSGSGSSKAVTQAALVDGGAAFTGTSSGLGGGTGGGMRIQAPLPPPVHAPPATAPAQPPHVRASSGWVRPARAADAAGAGVSIHDILDAAARPDGLTLRELLSPSAAGVMLRLALPSAVLLLAEWGTQQVLAVMAGQPLSGGEPPAATAERLAAHSVATHTVTLLYVPAMSLGIAAAVRVGAAVGDAHVPDARLAARAAAYAVAGYACLCGVLLVSLARAWPRLWSTNAAVVDAAAGVMPLLAGVVAFDAAQAVAGGVLRGLSRPGIAASIAVAAYGATGLPSAYAIGIAAGRGLAGLWAGFCIALVVATAATGFVLGAWTDWDAEAARAQRLARLTRPLAASVDADAALLRQLEELQHAGGTAFNESAAGGRPAVLV